MKLNNKTVSLVSIIEIICFLSSFVVIYTLDRKSVIDAGLLEWMTPFIIFAGVKVFILLASVFNLIKYVLR